MVTKIKEIIEKSWKYLRGKKRNIGTIIYLAGLGIEAFFPDLMPMKQITFIQTVGGAMAGFGVIDALARTKNGKKAVDSGVKLMHRINPIKAKVK
jgi:hypothetical protein